MRQLSAKITTHSLEPLGVPALVVQFLEPASLNPGQFLLAYLPGSKEAIRTRLFPTLISNQGFTSDHLPGPAWRPGETLNLLGPLGKPFTPPENTDRWFLLSLGNHPERLLPLIDLGGERSASIAFWAKGRSPWLPSFVERPVEPEEAVGWADFIALELPGLDWPQEFTPLWEFLQDQARCVRQALVDVPTPCGMAACQACALPSKGHWQLGCQSGLIVPMEAIRV
jgi:hypothetical protein